MVVSELRGEKIDIIPWNPEPARFVAKALSPARVREVYLDDDAKEATVVVPDDQLALAIGKEGMNARLAARLTGWKVDIQSEREFAAAEAEAAFGGGEEDEFSGRCAAILSNGKRCPNAALSGTRFCGVPAHQELAKVEAATGTYAEGSIQPVPAEAEPAEGEEAVAEVPPPEAPPTEPEPTPAPEEPAAQQPVRESGPVEGERGNREVPPAELRAPDQADEGDTAVEEVVAAEPEEREPAA
jgi:N utilization substance protein A